MSEHCSGDEPRVKGTDKPGGGRRSSCEHGPGLKPRGRASEPSAWGKGTGGFLTQDMGSCRLFLLRSQTPHLVCIKLKKYLTPLLNFAYYPKTNLVRP